MGPPIKLPVGYLKTRAVKCTAPLLKERDDESHRAESPYLGNCHRPGVHEHLDYFKF